MGNDIAPRDRLGSFFDAYGEYLRGERAYEDIPLLGGRRHSCPRCDREWVDHTATFGGTAAHVKLCADCEVWAREPRKPLPTCRLVRWHRGLSWFGWRP